MSYLVRDPKDRFSCINIQKQYCIPFRVHPPMLAVGSDDVNPSAGGKVQIYEYNGSTR